MSLTLEPYNWDLIHRIADEELELTGSDGVLDRIADRLDECNIFIDETIADELFSYFN